MKSLFVYLLSLSASNHLVYWKKLTLSSGSSSFSLRGQVHPASFTSDWVEWRMCGPLAGSLRPGFSQSVQASLRVSAKERLLLPNLGN